MPILILKTRQKQKQMKVSENMTCTEVCNKCDVQTNKDEPFAKRIIIF